MTATKSMAPRATDNLEFLNSQIAQLAKELNVMLTHAVYLGSVERGDDGDRSIFRCDTNVYAVVSNQPEHGEDATSVKFWFTTDFKEDVVSYWRTDAVALMSPDVAQGRLNAGIDVVDRCCELPLRAQAYFMHAGHLVPWEHDRAVFGGRSKYHVVLKLVRSPSVADPGVFEIKFSSIPLEKESDDWNFRIVSIPQHANIGWLHLKPFLRPLGAFGGLLNVETYPE